jgi:hypothetical protein
MPEIGGGEQRNDCDAGGSRRRPTCILRNASQRAEFFVPTFDSLVQINGDLMRVHSHA